MSDEQGRLGDAPSATPGPQTDDLPRDLYPIEDPPQGLTPVDEMIPEPPAAVQEPPDLASVVPEVGPAEVPQDADASVTEPAPAAGSDPMVETDAPATEPVAEATDTQGAEAEAEATSAESAQPQDSADTAASDAAESGVATEADTAEETAATVETEDTPPTTEVDPITAADIPALEGCDVEKSWSGDETCEGTEEVVAAAEVPDPEADSGLESAEGELTAEQLEVAAPVVGTPTWPYVVYLVVWVALCLLAGWQLLQIPIGQIISTTEIYRLTIIGGVVMTIAGPIVILAVWLASRVRAGEHSKAGLLSSALLKGAVVTLLGVAMWWGTFLIVDQARFGRFM